MNGWVAQLTFNTKVLMRRHRQIRWAPMPNVVPEWRQRDLARDLTGVGWSESAQRAAWGDR